MPETRFPALVFAALLAGVGSCDQQRQPRLQLADENWVGRSLVWHFREPCVYSKRLFLLKREPKRVMKAVSIE